MSLEFNNFWILIVLSTALVIAAGCASAPPVEELQTSYIVQGSSPTMAADAVRSVGGEITHELGVIRAVGAELTPSQVERLEAIQGLRIHDNRSVEVSGKPTKEAEFVDTVVPQLTVADHLHWEGITGAGVTIAVLDTGSWAYPPLTKDTSGRTRQLAQYDALSDTLLSTTLTTLSVNYLWDSQPVTSDDYGHGSHVASIALSSADAGAKSPLYNGVAPDAGLVAVKAFDHTGTGTYADVIRGVDWVIRHKAELRIRVLNCSFSAEPQSYYWDDPLNQAVMAAWQAGIVVVASAGNAGPESMTIGVPGNNPYVITVGAMTDNYTPYDQGDDSLATFSSTGPTVEGFVKPDVLAPGGHVLGLMDKNMALPIEYPEFYDGAHYFSMSGTSQAAAVVSGIVALMLQVDPTLTPDDVKCQLMSTARPRTYGGGSDQEAAYSILQQGAGLVHAWDAAYSKNYGCVNNGLDVTNDLSDIEHYGGRVNQDENGNFYLMDPNDDEGDGNYLLDGDGYLWSGAYLWNDGYVWSDAYFWNDAYLWNDAFLWNDAYFWNDAYLWNDAFLWNDGMATPMSVTVWVENE